MDEDDALDMEEEEPEQAVTVQQAAAAALQQLNQDMERDRMDPSTRKKIVAFAKLCRRSLLLHMTPNQRQVLATVPFCPDEGQQQQQPQQQQQQDAAVHGAEWSRDYFESGSMRYINRIVALQQMAYSHVALSHSQVPNLAEVFQFSNDRHAAQIKPQNAKLDSEPVTARADMQGWQLPLASYSATTIPRPLERDVDACVLAGAHAADILRLRASFQPD